MWIFWLVALALAVLVVVWLLRVASSSGAGSGASRSPEEILKERYARGEIDREEYQRRLGDLRE